MKLVTCKSCGTVHMGVTKEYAESEIKRFNDFYYSDLEKNRELYGRPSSMVEYRCWCPAPQYAPAKDGDCPEGCTIGPVVVEEELLEDVQ